MASPLPPKQLTAISKEMSRCLRHHPPPEMDAAGWVPVPVLLRLLRSPGATEAAVRHIVAADSKGRFVLDAASHPPRIRAAQGHSVPLEQPQLEAVASAQAVPLAVHITSEDGWRAIQESGELRRMSRTHIHFATEGRHLRRNAWAQVLLQLDAARALQDGHQLFLAANGVLLTEGPLPVRYVRRIQRTDLPPDWR